MKPTPLSEIEEMADGQTVMSIEGDVTFANGIKTGKIKQGPSAGNEWSLQAFTLSDGEVDIQCTLWDAAECPVQKGAYIRLEATKNKKGQWGGISKKIETYTDKQGNERTAHKLSINALSVNWLAGSVVPEDHVEPATNPKGAANGFSRGSEPIRSGLDEVRHYLMRAANLLRLSHNAAKAVMGEDYASEDGRTLFINASSKVNMMPDRPIHPVMDHPELPRPPIPEKYDEEKDSGWDQITNLLRDENGTERDEVTF